MPVTAKLSKLFYDRLGEEIADELVNWFNQVDATYRADLRELNELNFSRFDAKLEQRLAEFRADVQSEMYRLETKFEQRLADLHVQLATRIDRLETTLERRLAEQTRWLFGAWAALLIPIIGLWLRR